MDLARFGGLGYMCTMRLAVGLALVVSLGLSAPAKANVIYSMYGTCSDCTLDSPPSPPFPPFIASLTVPDSYLGGTQLTNADFVSFTYGGSNLIPRFTYSADDPLALPFSLMGILPPTPPLLPPNVPPIFIPPAGVGFILDFPTGCGPLLGVTVGPPPCRRPGLFFMLEQNQSWTLASESPADTGQLVVMTAARVVPSPAPLVLLGIGLIGLRALRSWRRR